MNEDGPVHTLGLFNALSSYLWSTPEDYIYLLDGVFSTYLGLQSPVSAGKKKKKKTTRAVLLQSTEYFKRSPNNESFVNKDHLLKTKTTWIEQTTSQSITCAELHCQTHVYIYPV